MKRLNFFLMVFLCLNAGVAFSQGKVWSLQDCIAYALDNNISIKQQAVQTEFQKNALDLSKLRLLPSLNGSVAHTFSFGRALDQTTYQFTQNQTVTSDNFRATSDMDIFRGLQNYNGIKKSQYDLLASQQDLNYIKDNIALTVALDYLQVLLNKELVTAADNQLQITKQQIGKTQKLVDAGSVARGNLLQIQAQAAQEELQLITNKNLLDISILTLTQLLELQTPQGFEVVVPQIPIDTNTVISGDINEIYNVAVGNRPEVKSSEYKLTSSQYSMKIAQGQRSPSLGLGNTFTTGYSSIRKKTVIDPVTGPTSVNYPFGQQFSDNMNYGLSFSLSIPILNGWQVNKAIDNARLTVENNQYALDLTKKTLYKNIQQAYTDAVAALKSYVSSLKAVASTEESFRYTEQRFNVGMVTPVDYNAAKTQLLNAQSNEAQSKYTFIFKTKVLDYYKGIPITLNK